MQNVYLSMELYVRPGNMCSCVMCFGTIMLNGLTVQHSINDPICLDSVVSELALFP